MKSFKPYYAVIFVSKKKENIPEYEPMAMAMVKLAKEQPGFLGVDSAQGEIGLTVSYWKNLEAISNWKQNTEHLVAQQKGRQDWYEWYDVKICKVEREYNFNK